MSEWIYDFFCFALASAILSFIIRILYPYVMRKSKTRLLRYPFEIFAFLIMVIFLFYLFIQIDLDFLDGRLIVWAAFFYSLNEPLQNFCDALIKNIPIYQKNIFQELFEWFFTDVIAILCMSLTSVLFAATWRY